MNTEFLGMAHFNGQAITPAEKVREDYFAQESAGMIGGFLCRMGWHDGKAHGGIFLGTDLKGVQ
jgi:hypothetical protein